MPIDVNCDCHSGWVYPTDGPKRPCPSCRPESPKKSKPIPRFKRPKQRSDKREEQDKTHVPLRRAIKAAIGYCDWCNRRRKWSQLEEHHIGRNRHKETMNPRRCLYVCADWLKDCHKRVDELSIEEQCQVAARASLRAVERCRN